MDFSIPPDFQQETEKFQGFLKSHLEPPLPAWYQQGAIPRSFFEKMGEMGWFGVEERDGRLRQHPALRGALLVEQLAKISPGVGVAMLVQSDLGLLGLTLFGSAAQQETFGPDAVKGKILISLGNTEGHAGSDVANISLQAQKFKGGWKLNGSKAYVTNGLLSDLAVITAVTDPDAPRNRRISMFLVDLDAEGVSRRKLNKQVWIPSDLTRIDFEDVYVPADHMLGEPGRGLQQVLTIFTHSRLAISALTLGTAAGAFELALQHARKRKVFGRELWDFQSKGFEISDLFARQEAARLVLYKACWAADNGRDFRLESSLAKYLAVQITREVTAWAADLFGAASVLFEHPIHKFPMDAWGSALGEGTQDVQKLIILREIMQRKQDEDTVRS